jgi:long-subunit acyl-CoA synthetase (AMP-forming)
MVGYRNAPEQTRMTVDADGWLATGDIGRLDDDGYLSIVDRKKELIINAAGKNMSPANIEAKLKSAGPLIGQACVIGDRRPYNVALLTLDPDGAEVFASQHGLPFDLASLARHRLVLEAVGREVAAANARLSRVEQPKRWHLLGAEWTPAGDELTPTMKLKRRQISAKHSAEIDALYAAPRDHQPNP